MRVRTKDGDDLTATMEGGIDKAYGNRKGETAGSGYFDGTVAFLRKFHYL